MTRFVQDKDQTQATLLPELIDDLVAADSPVRALHMLFCCRCEHLGDVL